MSTPIDHLVYATTNLEQGIADMETLLGVSAAPGGSHPGLGTRNALLSLGPACYLEIIAPDPEQTDFEGTRPFGVDALDQPRLTAWAARRSNLPEFVEEVALQGVELGQVFPMSRKTPDGAALHWHLTFLRADLEVALVPFLIDWGDTVHPATTCPGGAELRSLVLAHPQPAELAGVIDILQLPVTLTSADKPELRALISCPHGEVELK